MVIKVLLYKGISNKTCRSVCTCAQYVLHPGLGIGATKQLAVVAMGGGQLYPHQLWSQEITRVQLHSSQAYRHATCAVWVRGHWHGVGASCTTSTLPREIPRGLGLSLEPTGTLLMKLILVE